MINRCRSQRWWLRFETPTSVLASRNVSKSWMPALRRACWTPATATETPYTGGMNANRCFPSRAMAGTCTCRRHIAAARNRCDTLRAAIEAAPDEATAHQLVDELNRLTALVDHALV